MLRQTKIKVKMQPSAMLQPIALYNAPTMK